MNELDTLVVHGPKEPDPMYHAVNVPIYQTSTYQVDDVYHFPQFAYSRVANPTRQALEDQIAAMEHGAAGFAFASGMAATTAALMLFKAGDKLLLSSNVYGGTVNVLEKVFRPFGLSYEMIDTSDLALVESRITPDVAGLFIETPANPLLTITDLKGAAELAHKHGLLAIADNTFMTPYLQRPLDFGFDIVVESATKYLGGHSDLLAGLLVTGTQELADRVKVIRNFTGGILNPFDAWLLLRGIKTLAVRMDRHQSNTAYLAEYLREHPAVKKIYYPGFSDFPGYAVHGRQAGGAGAMISFELSEDYDRDVFMKSLKLITLAISLGGVESLMGYPVTMTHGAIPKAERDRIGITENFLRFSVGIEDKELLKADLEQALASAKY
ncbi:MAG: PLP-dependent transferase [Oscillospiraceae bacterium]|nr:PLP-dependent transferase [Oscillospiraceae bacterium]